MRALQLSSGLVLVGHYFFSFGVFAGDAPVPMPTPVIALLPSVGLASAGTLSEANVTGPALAGAGAGGGELALGISAEELAQCFVHYTDRVTLDEFRRCIDAKSTGAVRVSVGLATTFADVYRFSRFARTFLDRTADDLAEDAADIAAGPGR